MLSYSFSLNFSNCLIRTSCTTASKFYSGHMLPYSLLGVLASHDKVSFLQTLNVAWFVPVMLIFCHLGNFSYVLTSIQSNKCKMFFILYQSLIQFLNHCHSSFHMIVGHCCSCDNMHCSLIIFSTQSCFGVIFLIKELLLSSIIQRNELFFL